MPYHPNDHLPERPRSGVLARAYCIARNVFAVLGVVFVLLLARGIQQLESGSPATLASCAAARCM
jgi:hypothetical protein